jgi:hypothetical protein
MNRFLCQSRGFISLPQVRMTRVPFDCTQGWQKNSFPYLGLSALKCVYLCNFPAFVLAVGTQHVLIYQRSVN